MNENQGPNGRDGGAGQGTTQSAISKPNGEGDRSDADTLAGDQNNELAEDEIHFVDDLGNDFDDTDDYCVERENYWAELANAPPIPTRDAWLWHRLNECWEFLRALSRSRAPLEIDTRIPDEEWIRLYEQVFGPLPRPCEPSVGTTAPRTPLAETGLDTGSKTALKADFANLACRAAKASTAPGDTAGLGAHANLPTARELRQVKKFTARQLSRV